MGARADELQISSNNMKHLADVLRSEGLGGVAEQIDGLGGAYKLAANDLREHIKHVENQRIHG